MEEKNLEAEVDSCTTFSSFFLVWVGVEGGDHKHKFWGMFGCYNPSRFFNLQILKYTKEEEGDLKQKKNKTQNNRLMETRENWQTIVSLQDAVDYRSGHLVIYVQLLTVGAKGNVKSEGLGRLWWVSPDILHWHCAPHFIHLPVTMDRQERHYRWSSKSQRIHQCMGDLHVICFRNERVGSSEEWHPLTCHFHLNSNHPHFEGSVLIYYIFSILFRFISCFPL